MKDKKQSVKTASYKSDLKLCVCWQSLNDFTGQISARTHTMYSGIMKIMIPEVFGPVHFDMSSVYQCRKCMDIRTISVAIFFTS